MPTYEYECKACKHRFEVFQSISDEPIKRCPKCGRKVRRLIGGGLGIIFKGSGFYTTDYKRTSAVGGGNGSAKPKKEGGGESKSGSSGSSDKSAPGNS
jgi:putative FmdB family regulatory protein